MSHPLGVHIYNQKTRKLDEKGEKDQRAEMGHTNRKSPETVIQQQKKVNLRNWGNGYEKFFSFFGARFGNGRESAEIGRTLLRNPTG